MDVEIKTKNLNEENILDKLIREDKGLPKPHEVKVQEIKIKGKIIEEIRDLATDYCKEYWRNPSVVVLSYYYYRKLKQEILEDTKYSHFMKSGEIEYLDDLKVIETQKEAIIEVF